MGPPIPFSLCAEDGETVMKHEDLDAKMEIGSLVWHVLI